MGLEGTHPSWTTAWEAAWGWQEKAHLSILYLGVTLNCLCPEVTVPHCVQF